MTPSPRTSAVDTTAPPAIDPEHFRRLGHELVDLVSNYLSDVREHPVFRPMKPAERQALLQEVLRETGASPEAIVERFRAAVLPHELLISVTSAGQVVGTNDPPYFVLIEKALRDEGTSYHYLPPGDFSHIAPALLATLEDVLTQTPVPTYRGATWTTDAPFRETSSAVAHCRNLAIMAVEMEAAALYAFAEAQQKPVVCLAHVTNRMARTEGDFEKGIAGGSQDALQVVGLVARAWVRHQEPARGGT